MIDRDKENDLLNENDKLLEKQENLDSINETKIQEEMPSDLSITKEMLIDDITSNTLETNDEIETTNELETHSEATDEIEITNELETHSEATDEIETNDETNEFETTNQFKTSNEEVNEIGETNEFDFDENDEKIKEPINEELIDNFKNLENEYDETKTWSNNAQTEEVSVIDKDIEVSAPNKYLQPFAHQQWKILEQSAQNREEELKIRSKPNGISEFVYRFSKSFLGIFGIILLVVLILGSIIIPAISTDPQLSTENHYQQAFTPGHILGTDELGRDVWSRLWNGLNFSFRLAFMATAIDVFIGVVLGILMGHFKKFDLVMQWIIKVLSNIPSIIVLILATLVFQPSFWIFVMAMTFTGWIGMANQMRAQVKRASKFLWVQAEKVLGTPQWKVLLNYIPVLIPMLITQLVFTIPTAILSETTLAVIGLSIPGIATLGNMISEGSKIITLFPRYALIPSFMLILITTSIQFIGNSTQDALRRQR